MSIIPDWLFGGGAADESDTDRDGFLSYSGEIHAVGNGIAKGLAAVDPRPTAADSQAEPHYFRGGWAVGYLVKLIAVVYTLSVAL